MGMGSSHDMWILGVKLRLLAINTKTQLSLQKEKEIGHSRAKSEKPWPGNTSFGYPNSMFQCGRRFMKFLE